MKKFLLAVIGVGLLAILTFLAVTKHLAEQRAGRLDKEFLQAQARILELEADLQTAKDEMARLAKAPAGALPASSAGDKGGTAQLSQVSGSPAATSTSATLSGVLVKYAAAAGSGRTNLVRIEGTSSMHNWQVETQLIGGMAEFPAGLASQTADGPIEAHASAFIPVRSLKSKKSDGSLYSDAMDEIMYGKLLAEEHKRISFTLQSLKLKQRNAAGALECEATGLLGVAGQTNTVTMPVTISPEADGRLQLTGSLTTKMTDFKITPPAPKGAGGIIQTGDQVTLKFSWSVKPVATGTASK
jgi:hypothetical protein